MNHPETEWAIQDTWAKGFLWISTRVLGGASSVQLKFNAPCSCVCAYMYWLRREGRRRLRASRVWSRRQSQRFMGNLLLQLLSMVIRWFLNMWVPPLTELRFMDLGGNVLVVDVSGCDVFLLLSRFLVV